MKHFLFTALLVFSLAAYSQSADYLILSHPEDYLILNKYEQRFEQNLAPGLPLLVLDQNYVLSDGITQALKCSTKNTILFLRLDNQEPEILSNCTVLEDTVHIIRSGIRIDYFDNTRSVLEKDQLIKRIFKKGKRTYISDSTFGWCRLTKYSWKIPEKADRIVHEFPQFLYEKIARKIETANQDYQDFFSFFNNHFKRDLAVPKWQYALEEQRMIIRLKNPESGRQLKQSTAALTNDIQMVLIGHPVDLNETDGQIILIYEADL